LSRLQASLEEAQNKASPEEAVNYANVRFWALYVGATAEKQYNKDEARQSRETNSSLSVSSAKRKT